MQLIASKENNHEELYSTIALILRTECSSAIELLITHGYLAEYLQQRPELASHRITKSRDSAAIAWLSAQKNQAPISPNKYTMWSTPEPIDTGTSNSQQDNAILKDGWPEELKFLLKFA